MTDQELRDLVGSLTGKHAALAEAQRETDRQLQETDRILRESKIENDRGFRELRELVSNLEVASDRDARELRQQLGGLSSKFGSFTEGLALPSMTKILTQRFGMDFVSPRILARDNGNSLELDVLSWSKSRDEVYIVEVKSHLRQEALVQMRKILRSFPKFFPQHRGKKVYGILAAVDIPSRVQEKVLEEGLYLARIHDGQFELQVPEDFRPRAF